MAHTNTIAVITTHMDDDYVVSVQTHHTLVEDAPVLSFYLSISDASSED